MLKFIKLKCKVVLSYTTEFSHNLFSHRMAKRPNTLIFQQTTGCLSLSGQYNESLFKEGIVSLNL